MYALLFRLVLSRVDPERAHGMASSVIRWIPGFLRKWMGPEPTQAVEALGLRFPSPFGLAAGFDKNASAIRGLGVLGFGHIEVGTVTALAQPGNPTPRLFRLIPDRALINRMGFNNAGVEAAVRKLTRERRRRHRPVIGVNIGKSRAVAVDDALEDYLHSTRLLAGLADYLVVNVSSPNTPGLRGLQELDALTPLLTEVMSAARDTPVLVKIAPDMSDEQAERIAALAVEIGLAGIVATNTTVGRGGLRSRKADVAAAGEGGLSGAPLAERSRQVLRVLRAAVPADFVIISVGGVETADDVRDRLAAGATLVQGYTGFIYRGPFWARQINRGLRRGTRPA